MSSKQRAPALGGLFERLERQAAKLALLEPYSDAYTFGIVQDWSSERSTSVSSRWNRGTLIATRVVFFSGTCAGSGPRHPKPRPASRPRR